MPILIPNSTLGPYSILSKIGEGGMGEVWRARDEKLGRDVAIKVLPGAFSGDKSRLARFEQEAQAAGALNHPNILVIYHIGTHEGAPYIVSELLEGETLRDRMGGGALPQRKAIDYALQIAHGLAAAHEKRIVHRDLKPDNLFITKDGRVKILDFGLAKLLGRPDAETEGRGDDIATLLAASPRHPVPASPNTDPGTVMGTIGYMSPEQLRGQPADHRSDIFSFGAILYEMLCGRRAFRGQSTADTMSAILREDPPDISETNKAVSPALERVVRHCLEKSPEERFHSASDLAFAIEALSGSTGNSTTVLATLPGPRRNFAKLLPWTIAGVALVASTALAWLYFQQTPAVEQPVRFAVSMPKEAIEASSPAISPDGRTLAFVIVSEGKRNLYIRPLSQLEAQPLAGTEDAQFPFWSPDSRYIGFFSNNKLKKIEVSGGPTQTLCDAPSAFGGTWNADGVILIGLDTKGINRVSSAGGTPVRIIPRDESRKEIAQAWPVFLPDGNHFLYQSWNGRSDDSAIFVASLGGSDRKLLLKADSSPLYAAPGYLLFARGATLTAQSFDVRTLELTGEPFPVAEQIGYNSFMSYANASVSVNGTVAFLTGGVANRQLIWFDRSGKQLESVGTPGEINDIVLSRDGKRLAMQRLEDGNSDIWLMDLARGVPSRFTFEATVEDFPVWSPDGNFVVFSSGGAGPDVFFNLYRKVSSGAGNPEPLFESDQTKEPTDWSRDGRFILLNAYDGIDGSDIWVLPVFGDGKAYALLKTAFEESSASFSPDGRWFAYISNETGRAEVYIQTFPQTGGKWLISNGGGGQPRWRADGKELFYIAPDKTLMSVEVKTESTLETAAPKPLFITKVRSSNSTNRYVVTSDGQRFLINAPAGDVGVAPIILILNWASSLKK